MPPFERLETPRLLLRRFVLEDLTPFVTYRADPDVARYQSWSDYDEARGRALIASMQGKEPGVPGQWFQFALEARESRLLVGDLALKVNEAEPREAEVGFTLAPGHQGRGYGTEALRALLGYCFGTLGLHRVVAVTDALNAPAAALLERVGMRREAHYVENVWFKGAWGSEFLYAVLARELSGAPEASRRTP